MEDCQRNDENIFDPNGTGGFGRKTTDNLNDSRNRGIDKTPLKPLNDASRLTGNAKDLKPETSKFSSPSNCNRQFDSTERVSNTSSSQCDLDELSALLKGLDITKANIDAQTTNVTPDHTFPDVCPGAGNPINKKEFENVDDDIQFGKPNLISSEAGPEFHSDVDDDEISAPEPVDVDDGIVTDNFDDNSEKTAQDSMNNDEKQTRDETQHSKSDKDPFINQSTVSSSMLPVSEDLADDTSKFESENPFATVSRVANSPIVSKEESVNGLEDLDVEQPFSTKNKVMNSPLKDEGFNLDNVSENDRISDSAVEETDTAEKAEIDCSGVDDISFSCQTSEKVMAENEDSDSLQTEEVDGNNSFTILKTGVNSPAKTMDDQETGALCGDEEISFGCKLVQSVVPSSERTEDKPEDNPTLSSEDSAISQSLTTDTYPVECDSDNPFGTQNKLVSSPVIPKVQESGDQIPELDVQNPFETQSKIVNSPVVNREQSQAIDIEDPFSTKNKIMNSPVKTEDMNIDDPSATQFKLSNSPLVSTGKLSGHDHTLGNGDLLSSTEEKVESMDTPLSTVQTDADISQAVNKEDPMDCIKDSENEELLSEKCDDKDKRESLYPSAKAVGDGMEEEQNCSIDKCVSEDPFSTKSKVANSPVRDQSEDVIQCADIKDPFTTELNVANPPVGSLSEEPGCTTMKNAMTSSERVELNSTDPAEDSDAVYASSKDDSGAVDPFTTRSNVMNSPLTDKSDSVYPSAKAVGDNMKEEQNFSIDPFSTKSKVANSPVKDQSEDVIQCLSEEADCATTKNLAIEDPFTTKTKVANSPTKSQSGESEDPVTTQSTFAKPPVKNQIEDCVPSPEVEDPLSTKKKVESSPAKNQNEDSSKYLISEDPFSTRTKISNSPIKDENIETNCSSVNLLDTEDPFSSKSKIVNSPAKSSEEEQNYSTEISLSVEDPFSTKSRIVNSPAKHEDEVLDSTSITSFEANDPFSTKSQIANSPDRNVLDRFIETNDPFSTQSKISNSPVHVSSEGSNGAAEEEFNKDSSSQNKLEDEVTVPSFVEELNEENPFQTKTQLMNSPISVMDTNENDSQLKKSPQSVVPAPSVNEENPFQTKTQLMNSPISVMNTNENDSQLKKSPQSVVPAPSVNEENPFQTKTQLMNSPISVMDTNENDSQLKKSPQTEVAAPSVNEENPFQTKTQLMNSPVPMKDIKGNDAQLTTVTLTEDKTNTEDAESSDDEDVFQSFDNSPVKELEEEDLFSVKSPLIDSPRDRKVVADLFQSKGAAKDIESLANSIPAEQSPRPVMEKIGKDSLNIDDLVMAMKNEGLGGAKNTADELDEIDTQDGADMKASVTNEQSDDLPEEDVQMEVATDSCDTDKRESTPDYIVKTTSEGSGCNGQNNDIFAEAKQVGLVEEEQQMISGGQASDVSPLRTEEQSNSGASSEKVSDDFEDNMFVNAVEAFDSAGILDKLEKDFSTQEMARNLNRGSVLLKFDPLAEKRGSPKRPPRVSEIFKGSSAPSDDGVCLFGTPPKKVIRRPATNMRVPGIAKDSIEEESTAHEVDMMLEMDASEVMRGPVVSNPLSVAPHLIDVVTTFSEADFNKLKLDLTLHYEERLLQKDRDFEKQRQEVQEEQNKRLAELEEKIDTLTEEKGKLTTKAESFKTKLHKNKYLFEDYVSLIKKLSDENKMLESKISFLTHECTQAKEDCKTLDKSFDDLFHRYEKMKSTLTQCSENETALKKSLEQSNEKYKEKVEAMKNLKEKAEAKLSEQAEQIEKLTTSSKAEVSKLEVVVKRKEMEIRSLTDSLERKKAENVELTDLCDSLINKVSGK